MSVVDRLREAGWRAIERPGRLRDAARRVNDALGRPLASAEELADRAAFAAGYGSVPVAPAAPAPAAKAAPEAAPVLVYHLDKHRRDLPKLTQILDAAEIPYRVMNLEGDEATQAAVRRDAGGRKLPLVFIAGALAGGREELINLERSGELRRRVFGG